MFLEQDRVLLHPLLHLSAVIKTVVLRVVLVLSISYETEVVVVANDPLLLIILQKLRHDVDDVLDVLQIVVLGICDEVIDLNLGFANNAIDLTRRFSLGSNC